MVIFNGDAYVASSMVAGIRPPGVPWYPFAKTATSNTASELAALRQTIAQQELTIQSLSSRVGTLTGRVNQATSGFQTISLTSTGLDLSPKGSAIPFVSLLNRLLEVPIKIGTLDIMAFRSVLGRILTRLTASEASIADISGNRLPQVLSEQAANAAADVLREAVQAAKDATQDAASAAAQLAAQSAQSDIAGVAARVSTLEQAPAFDPTPLQAAIAAKADAAALTDAVAQINSQAAVIGQVADSVATVSNALGTKVEQEAFNILNLQVNAFVESTNAGFATKANVADVEAKGRLTALEVAVQDVRGINAAYWAEALGSSALSSMAAGKIWQLIAEHDISFFLGDLSSAVEGTVYRFKNGMEAYKIAINFGTGDAPGPVFEAQAGELLTVAKTSAGWQIM